METNNTKHTPGPWKAGPPATGLNPSEHRYIHAGGELVARASAGYAPNHRLADQLDANAKLIAAAPDLLRACQLFLAAQSARRHPLGAPDEGIATICAEAASVSQAAIAEIEGA